MLGHGRQTGIMPAGRYGAWTVDTVYRIRLTPVFGAEDDTGEIDAIRRSAATGVQGDDAIYIRPVERIVRFSTGEEGEVVLAYEGDIYIQGIISPPPDLSDLLAYCQERMK